jgi:cell wall-associated NlpC family hydrolase
MEDRLTMIENAIRWAKAHIGADAYRTRCLAFVEDAYELGNGIEIFGGSTATESAVAYGVETGQPPAGAFVFYECWGTLFDLYQNWGHVGLALGDGRVIHAWDQVRIDPYLDVEKLIGAPGWNQPRYLGWTGVERILQGHRKRPDLAPQVTLNTAPTDMERRR